MKGISSRLLVMVSILITIETQSQNYSSETCKIERNHLGNRKIIMTDGSELEGIKVKLKPFCAL